MNEFTVYLLVLLLLIRHTPLAMHPTPLCIKPYCPQRRLHLSEGLIYFMFPVRQLNHDHFLHGSGFIRDDVAGENRMCNGLATANCHITKYISRLAKHRQ